jgi:hypothetical protein
MGGDQAGEDRVQVEAGDGDGGGAHGIMLGRFHIRASK